MLYSIFWFALLVCPPLSHQGSITGDPQNACPFWSDGSYLDGICYKLVSTHSNNWSEAQTSCGDMTHSGRLAEPKTSQQFIHLLNSIKTTSIDKCVWLGAKRANPYPGSLSSFAWVSQGDSLASDIHNHVRVSLNTSSAVLECLNFTSDGQLIDQTDCNNLCHYICEQYVGDPCQNALPGGEFHQGQCYRFQATPLVTSAAQTFCSDSNASLAEPNTNEKFHFVQSLSRNNLYKTHTLGTDEFYDTADTYGGLLADLELTLFIKSCGEVNIFLSDSSFSSSTNDMLHFFLQGTSRTHVLSRCQDSRTNCVQLASTQTSQDILVCDEWQKFLFEWSNNVVIVSHQAQTDTVIFLNSMSVIPAISYLGLSVACGSGAEIIIGDTTDDKGVLLGAEYNPGLSSYVWPSSQDTVSSSLWQVGEPSTSTGHQNQTAILTPAMTLFSIDGSDSSHRFICQRDPFLYSYLAVVPTGGSDVMAPNLVISTERLEVVYISVRETLDAASNTTPGWLTRAIPYLQLLNQNVQLSGMGLHSNYVMIRATRLVTVHLISTTQDYSFATVVLPEGKLTSQYLLVTLPEVTGSTNHFTVTALEEGLTNVDIYFSCRNISVVLIGWEILRPSYGSVTLTQFQSIMIQNEADFTGTVITATNPVAVFVGFSSETRHSFMQALPTSTFSSQYVAFAPSHDLNSPPILSDLGARVQALHMEVALESTGSVDLRDNGGYAWDVVSSKEEYVLIQGDNLMMAILAPMIADDLRDSATSSSPSCLMPIVPRILWKSEYSVCLDTEILASFSNFLYVIFDTEVMDSLLYNENQLNGTATCQEIQDGTGDTTLTGCVVEIGQQCWSLESDTSENLFAAYILAHSSDDILCYPAGLGSFWTNPGLENLDESQLLSIPFSCTKTIPDTPGITTDITTVTTTMETTTATTSIPVTPNLDASQAAAEIKQDLEIDVTSTSRYRRKKKSIADKRTSSMAIGLTGMACCACVWAFVLILDIGRFGLGKHAKNKIK